MIVRPVRVITSPFEIHERARRNPLCLQVDDERRLREIVGLRQEGPARIEVSVDQRDLDVEIVVGVAIVCVIAVWYGDEQISRVPRNADMHVDDLEVFGHVRGEILWQEPNRQCENGGSDTEVHGAEDAVQLVSVAQVCAGAEYACQRVRRLGVASRWARARSPRSRRGASYRRSAPARRAGSSD